ncbi:MAG: S1C family serine protease [Gemmiger sp.]
MNNEYDYSGLYHTSDGQGGAQPSGQSNPQEAASGQQGGYPNVGSSGMNTANTARTDYSSQTQGGYTPPQNNAGGYTSSFGSAQGSYNGYSYSSAPQQPAPKKHGGAKKIGMRVLAGVCCVALGFGGGFAGALVANRTGLGTPQVVVQQIAREDSAAASPMGSAAGSALTTQEVAAIVQPSVVAITTEQMVSANTWFGGSYVQSGAGSGVIISEDGYILTCAHVVSGASNIKVQLSDDTTYTATLIGGDTSADIAVLKIEASGLTPAVLGDSDALAVGETTIAVGNPLGTLGGTVTNGIVSALNREVEVENNQMTLIQTNASISPGNSGGGLFNGNGELIGIVNAKSGYSEAEGLGFAIPINSAMDIAQELISNGYVKRPVLGITVITVDSSNMMQYNVSAPGVYIASVNDGSGAAKAGLQSGDRILSIGDVAVNTTTDVTGYIKDKAIGDTVTLQIDRGGSLISVDVVLGESTAN